MLCCVYFVCCVVLFDVLTVTCSCTCSYLRAVALVYAFLPFYFVVCDVALLQVLYSHRLVTRRISSCRIGNWRHFVFHMSHSSRYSSRHSSTLHSSTRHSSTRLIVFSSLFLLFFSSSLFSLLLSFFFYHGFLTNPFPSTLVRSGPGNALLFLGCTCTQTGLSVSAVKVKI